jgi:hypothetical protein
MDTRTQTRLLAAIDANDGRLTVPTADQLGLNRVTLKRAADQGIIDRLGRGTYGRPGDGTATLVAAGAAVSPHALLGYRGACTFYGLDGVRSTPLEWCVPHGCCPSSPLVHQRRRYDELDVTVIDGLAITTVPQTLVDIATVEHPDIVERAVESAIRLKLVTDAELRAFVALRAISRHGGRRLRAVLKLRPVGSRPTGSDDETICLQVYRRRGVPTPVRQYELVLDGVVVAYVDFAWPLWKFIVEIDGFDTHGDPIAHGNDLHRQNWISDIRITFRRFNHADVRYRPAYLCQETMRGLQEAGRPL